MIINGKNQRALWYENNILNIIDQRKLPYKIDIYKARTVKEVEYAIKEMVIRGAPSIGATAVYGMVLGKNDIEKTSNQLKKTRPTANDLFYAINYMKNEYDKDKNLLISANEYVENIIKTCRKIGEIGEKIIGHNMNILTHCNAGALATVDYGTALSPIRFANNKGKKINVYVDETRPRCQGLLTSWELKNEGIPYQLIVDNAAGYYMKNGEIDIAIVGADRIAKNGDFANKIGTYEKAVLAKENNIPFYVAAPFSTFDKNIKTGEEIIIEERDRNEIIQINGKKIMPNWIKTKNPAFDVTPKEYVSGYITEKGIIQY